MSHPDPPQVPSGPWHPRTWVPLLRELRAQGMDMSPVCAHVFRWRNPQWRLTASIAEGVVQVSLFRRQGRTYVDLLVDEFFPDSPERARSILSAWGVLPSLEERAA